jgi:hypothetical protein
LSSAERIAVESDSARLLLRETLGSFVHAQPLLRYADAHAAHFLERVADPYLHELRLLSDALGTAGAIALNLSYEWGCTTIAINSADGSPRLYRVLDWIFRNLGKRIEIAHRSSSAGDWVNIGWAGVSGVLTAMAPGRFAVALNQAPMAKHGLGWIGDWLVNRIRVFHAASPARGLPPAHHLRRVVETAADFREALALLHDGPVALPVIYTIVGTRPGEGAVVKRAPGRFTKIRMIGTEQPGARVCTANHFETEIRGWRARPIDSRGRAACAAEIDAQEFARHELEGPHAWMRSPILNRDTRLVAMADAAGGVVQAQGFDAKGAVTANTTVSRT